jgi:hypothetical protein
MFLNIDIQKKFVEMISHFKKEISLIMYIIEKNYKLNFNHFIWIKFQ